MFLFVIAALLVMVSMVGVYALGAFAIVMLFVVINNYIDGVYDKDKSPKENDENSNNV